MVNNPEYRVLGRRVVAAHEWVVANLKQTQSGSFPKTGYPPQSQAGAGYFRRLCPVHLSVPGRSVSGVGGGELHGRRRST